MSDWMQQVREMQTQTTIDPIDELIPPPRPRWLRFVVAFLIVAMVATGSELWGQGYLIPKPDCCGNAMTNPRMERTADGNAVTVTALFYNSSGKGITISSATADLPGATVLGIAVSDEFPFPPPLGTTQISKLPIVVNSHKSVVLFVTFVPNTCVDTSEPWGKIRTQLNVANTRLPSFTRSYTMPDAVVDRDGIDVSPLDGQSTVHRTGPLAAACALLGRAT